MSSATTSPSWDTPSLVHLADTHLFAPEAQQEGVCPVPPWGHVAWHEWPLSTAVDDEEVLVLPVGQGSRGS